MDKKNFAFDRMNYILLAIGMAIVVLALQNRPMTQTSSVQEE